jgi:hypothetical protein
VQAPPSGPRRRRNDAPPGRQGAAKARRTSPRCLTRSLVGNTWSAPGSRGQRTAAGQALTTARGQTARPVRGMPWPAYPASGGTGRLDPSQSSASRYRNRPAASANAGCPRCGSGEARRPWGSGWNRCLRRRCATGPWGSAPGAPPPRALRQGWPDLQAGNGWMVEAERRHDFDPLDPDQRRAWLAAESSDGRGRPLGREIVRAGAGAEGYGQPPLTGGPPGGGARPWWSPSCLTPCDRTMTRAGLGLTRWADDCGVRCRTRAAAQRALATAERLLQEAGGVRLHPQNTRLVPSSPGLECLGSQGQQGPGHRLLATKRRGRAQPPTLSADPREQASTRVRDHRRKRTRRKAPLPLQARIDRSQPGMRGGGTV